MIDKASARSSKKAMSDSFYSGTYSLNETLSSGICSDSGRIRREYIGVNPANHRMHNLAEWHGSCHVSP